MCICFVDDVVGGPCLDDPAMCWDVSGVCFLLGKCVKGTMTGCVSCVGNVVGVSCPDGPSMCWLCDLCICYLANGARMSCRMCVMCICFVGGVMGLSCVDGPDNVLGCDRRVSVAWQLCQGHHAGMCVVRI